MYSNNNPNMYTTGFDSGSSQYGQGQFQYNQGPPQLQGFVATQQTGFPAGGMQAQRTGFQSAGLQAQYTGYPGMPGQQQQQQQQQQYPPMPPLPMPQIAHAQQYGLNGPSPASSEALPQAPQPTGMTTAQMADSFRATSQKPSTSLASAGTKSKIPSVRLSFITATDQAKFEQLFKSAVGESQAMSGEQARDLLLRSKLSGDALSSIWLLSDTTKSGQLLFPEFALAMYLCNLKLNSKPLPTSLPEKIKNEVASMVDIISFATPEDRATALGLSRTTLPSASSPASALQIQQPQPTQPSNSQLLAQLLPQATGYTGNFQPQPTGLMSQPTGFPGASSVAYNGPRPPMPPMPAMPIGYDNFSAPLNTQPTGRAGQWGLVNGPAAGLPNIEALRSQMMPQEGREGAFTTTGLRGNATIPWAVTKQEKRMYDDLFKAWDGFGKGYITGNQAIEIFGQSGLDKSDLEKVWTLSDPGNKGRLDLDEFAVAMHVIYRKLNGYPIPNRLPPELIPPSTRHLNDSIGSIKSLLTRDAEERKTSGAFLQPQKTGVSYLKNRSFRSANGNITDERKDATVFKNNDEDFGYRSSARRRMGAGGRSPSPAQSSTASDSIDDLTIEQLQKKIREKEVLLDAVDFQDENEADQDEVLDRKDRRDADELYQRIRRVQEDIDRHPDSMPRVAGTDAERRTFKRRLEALTDRLPELGSSVRRTENLISDAKLELFRLQDAKKYPGSSTPVAGTGPDGTITESDRLKARARAMMQQRSAALAGRPLPAGADDSGAAVKRLEAEKSRLALDKTNNERLVHEVEESVRGFGKGIEDSLREGSEDRNTEHERRRWEDALGVEDDVKEFIFDLERSSRSARVRKESQPPANRQDNTQAPPGPQEQREASAKISSPAVAKEGSYSSYNSAEDRAAFIKQQAEQRMAERLAALGIKAPVKPGQTLQQRQEREREERIRQAEAEDSRREQERQRRIESESVAPPSGDSGSGSSQKKPPPPPSRKANRDSKQLDINAAEQAIVQEWGSQEEERKGLGDDEELRKQQAESEARAEALQEQVRLGQAKKEAERRQREASQKEASDRAARLTARRTELEAAKARELELQRQLDTLENESDNIDTETTDVQAAREPVVTNGNEAMIPPSALPAANASPSVTSPLDTGSRNPYLNKIQSADSGTASTDNNPFHRLTQQQNPQAQPAAASSPPPTRSSRVREEDDWSVVDDDDANSSSGDEAPSPVGGGAKHLASILFGTMAPPRSLSSMDNRSPSAVPGAGSTSITSSTSAIPQSPAVPPSSDTRDAAPMPASFAPITVVSETHMPSADTAPLSVDDVVPPPPPPPPPTAAAPAPPPPPPPPPPMPAASNSAASEPGNRGALLSQIQLGRGLKKVQTKDSSVATSAGRVL